MFMLDFELRIWDATEEKMVYPGDGRYIIHLDGVVEKLNSETQHYCYYPAIVMFFSGKFDGTPFEDLPKDMQESVLEYGTSRNDYQGIRIYTGDILDNGERRWIVAWDSGHSCVGAIDTGDPSRKEIRIDDIDISNCRVIGNMYKNPELVFKEEVEQ